MPSPSTGPAPPSRVLLFQHCFDSGRGAATPGLGAIAGLDDGRWDVNSTADLPLPSVPLSLVPCEGVCTATTIGMEVWAWADRREHSQGFRVRGSKQVSHFMGSSHFRAGSMCSACHLVADRVELACNFAKWYQWKLFVARDWQALVGLQTPSRASYILRGPLTVLLP